MCSRFYSRRKRTEQQKAIWLEEARQARRTDTSGLCVAGQKNGQMKSDHLSSAQKKSVLTMVQQNRKRRRTKRSRAKRGNSGQIVQYRSWWKQGNIKMAAEWARITLHTGFTKISLSHKKSKFCWQQQGRRAERTNVKHDWQVLHQKNTLVVE